MGDLVAFPQSRNIGKARHVAALWLSKASQIERERYWRLVTARFSEAISRVGFDEAVINSQVSDFAALVEFEINRLAGSIPKDRKL